MYRYLERMFCFFENYIHVTALDLEEWSGVGGRSGIRIVSEL